MINYPAITMFLIFVFATLVITFWASKKTKSRSHFYAAGGKVTSMQNGLAIAGDYMSAASFLGISGLVYLSGYDGLIYSIGFLAALGSLITVALYLIAQMVGAGKLIQLLFGLPYELAVIIVGVLMIMYVSFGGMLATTWVQIIKAVLLLSGATFMTIAVMRNVDFNFEVLFQKAINVHPKNFKIMQPGGLVSDPVSAISLGIALMFGTAGLPHILMRFFTVKNAKDARKSVFFATGFIGYFYILTFIIGF